MSKTAQRKAAMYDQGYKDGRTGHHFYWLKHPHLTEYQRGYVQGQYERLRLIRAQRPVMLLQALALMVSGALIVFAMFFTVAG